MAMYERRLFLKPICKTERNVPSGVSSDITTGTHFFGSPWNRLMYLKRIEIGRGCNGVSGCAEVEIWDNFSDSVTGVSGFEERKHITIPDGTAQLNWDETADVPILGDVWVFPSISGLDITICAQTMGC